MATTATSTVNQFIGNRKLPNPTAPSHFSIISGNEDRTQRPTRISPRKLPKLYANK